MIDLDSETDGLYKLLIDGDAQPNGSLIQTNTKTLYTSHQASSPYSINKVCTIPMQSIWNFRLGHLSHERLSRMSQLYFNIHHDNKVVCDIFHFARHKKLTYYTSVSKA